MLLFSQMHMRSTCHCIKEEKSVLLKHNDTTQKSFAYMKDYSTNAKKQKALT
jgi:hypothetical protein